MKSIIYDLIYNQKGLSLQEIAAHVLVSALLGVVIYISYAISHRGTVYSRKFNVSLLILTTLTGTVMTVIGNNVALSLGMVGALSIVRFRTALKDTRDTVYVFWTIIAGICCGVGDYVVAAVGSGAVFLLLLLFGAIKNDSRMLLIIRGSRSVEGEVQSLLFRRFSKKAVLRVNNTTPDSFELIYELSARTLNKSRREAGDICDPIYALGSIEYVDLVLQNDEISG
ncbi:MAG: DUF4956 domain-containing protein [Oscillospiraceae bacterium]|nr:DUF4956 domain-containing protein [Oscillospiraceae bacterium]